MRTHLGIALLAPLFLAGVARAQAVQEVVSFGDSLSDNGNLFDAIGYPPPPYWMGRFSNGPVWVERMAPYLGVPSPLIEDLAVGGATTDDVLAQQVMPYLAANGTVPDDALVTVWAGANDLLGLIDDPNQDPNALIENAVSNLTVSLTLLLQAGAEHVVVVNLPDLGLTPGVIEIGNPLVTALATAVSQAFDDALALAVSQVEARFGVDVVEIDAFQLLRDVVADPAAYGFVDATDPAYDETTGTVDPDEARYLFWDLIHPTTRAHRVFAGAVLDALGLR